MDFEFTKEQLMFKKEVIRFAKKEIVPRVQEYDLNKTFDLESFRKLGDFGILGLHFPEEYGGGGADVVTTVVAGEALGEAGVDGGLTLAYGAHTFLCSDSIFRHGTDEQRQKYIPKLASGEWIGCMGLTEPDAGSDVASLQTLAEKKGDRYILNGNKMFITNGPIADVAGKMIILVDDEDRENEGDLTMAAEKATPEAINFMAKYGRGLICLSMTGEMCDKLELPLMVDNNTSQFGTGFTVSIEGSGKIKNIVPKHGGKELTVAADFNLDETRVGDSIAVNGACLTVVHLSGNSFQADVSPETLAKTTFQETRLSERVNLERALRLSDRLDGHLVSGHIDGTGTIKTYSRAGNAQIITINVSEELSGYMIEKGSVAVDGISLTINACSRDSFEVSIIPHTASITTLTQKKSGDNVNIETDMIGKYVKRFLIKNPENNRDTNPPSFGMEFLAKSGFL